MILVLGGAKSGKTSWAEDYSARWASARQDGQVVYLATAMAWDDEMRLRIKRHRESRPSEWLTVEEPLRVARVINELSPGENRIVLFDCLTLWLTNLLMELGEDFKQESAETLIASELETLIGAISDFRGEVVIVSNLVETGLVSPHFLGRIFQELAGRCHQRLAAVSEQTLTVTAGLPQWLKR